MSTQRTSTWGGDYHYNHTEGAIDDGNFFGFTVQEDGTIVSLMQGGKEGQVPSPADDFLVSSNVSGKSLSKGALITIPIGNVIQYFDLSVGSVILHRSTGV